MSTILEQVKAFTNGDDASFIVNPLFSIVEQLLAYVNQKADKPSGYSTTFVKKAFLDVIDKEELSKEPGDYAVEYTKFFGNIFTKDAALKLFTSDENSAVAVTPIDSEHLNDKEFNLRPLIEYIASINNTFKGMQITHCVSRIKTYEVSDNTSHTRLNIFFVYNITDVDLLLGPVIADPVQVTKTRTKAYTNESRSKIIRNVLNKQVIGDGIYIPLLTLCYVKTSIKDKKDFWKITKTVMRDESAAFHVAGMTPYEWNYGYYSFILDQGSPFAVRTNGSELHAQMEASTSTDIDGSIMSLKALLPGELQVSTVVPEKESVVPINKSLPIMTTNGDDEVKQPKVKSGGSKRTNPKRTPKPKPASVPKIPGDTLVEALMA